MIGNGVRGRLLSVTKQPYGMSKGERRVDGLAILARSMSTATSGGQNGKPFKYGNRWQYHSRSDRHSKIACWAILFDLLHECALLREHVKADKVAVGINHKMRDFAHNRAKDLDLVICRAVRDSHGNMGTFSDLIGPYTIALDKEEQRRLTELPIVHLALPSSVLVALEAKACMTAFGKARPRLYDELNSSHLTIHGDTDGAIAAGFAMVNIAQTFISPISNHWSFASHEPTITRHRQPKDAASVVAKLMELPRRARLGEEGFDAFAIALVNCPNDGSPVTVHTSAPAPAPSDIYEYSQMIGRIAQLYATRFSGI